MRRVFLSLVFALLNGGCAGRIPLPKNHEVADAAALVRKMQAAHIAARAYSAEARLTYFGSEGRFKGTASLLVARPDKLRYELQGPHGGVLFAVACDGQTLSLLDMGTGNLQRLPATPENLDTMLKLVPLGLPIADWVSLLFGEVNVPTTAQLAYDDRDGMYVLTWVNGAPVAQERRVELRVAPDSGRITGIILRHGEAVLSDVRLTSYTSEGLPEVLRLSVLAQDADLEVRLRDVVLDPPTEPTVFTLSPSP